MKIIVLSIAQYKEKDGIVQALTPEGVCSFTVKGIFDPKNKNTALNNVMTVAEVDATDGRYRYPLIKSSTVIHSPVKMGADLTYYAALSFLAETTIKLMQDDEKVSMFKHLEAAIAALKNNSEPWMTLLIYLANTFKATGYEFEVNRCLFCGSKQDIRVFSFQEGGFICGNCLKEGIDDHLNNEQKLLLRSAFLSPDYAHISDYCNKENAIAILKSSRDFINDSYGVNIDAINSLA